MKITMTAIAVALYTCLAAGAAPPPWSAKAQLPGQASARAQPQSKAIAVPVVVPPVVPPIVPEVVVAFTGGQSAQTAQQQAAIAAVQDATTTARIRIGQAVTVSIITMTGTQRSLRSQAFRPAGRTGNLETTLWSFADRFGRRIGQGNMLCRWATVTRRLCWGEIRLPRGRLVLLGSSQTRGLGEFAVIGGTGVYTFRQGLLVFRQLSLSKYAIRVLLA